MKADGSLVTVKADDAQRNKISSEPADTGSGGGVSQEDNTATQVQDSGSEEESLEVSGNDDGGENQDAA